MFPENEPKWYDFPSTSNEGSSAAPKLSPKASLTVFEAQVPEITTAEGVAAAKSEPLLEEL